MRSRMLALAEFLLARFGIPQGHESLMGDLVEDYGSGRSALWLLRQTANAITSTVARDIRNHKLLAVRAIATGWALQLVWVGIIHLAEPRPYVWHKGPIYYWAILLLSSITPLADITSGGWLPEPTALTRPRWCCSMPHRGWLGVFGIPGDALCRDQAHGPIPNQLSIDIELKIAFCLMSTLVGGLLPKPRMRSDDEVAR